MGFEGFTCFNSEIKLRYICYSSSSFHVSKHTVFTRNKNQRKIEIEKEKNQPRQITSLTIANIVSDKILSLSSGEVDQHEMLLAKLVLKSSKQTKGCREVLDLITTVFDCYFPTVSAEIEIN